jgi:hypothetical protein
MITYIIVTRNPTSKRLVVIEEAADTGDCAVISEFDTEDEAYLHAEAIPICRAWGAEVLPVGEMGLV